ncbi:MULTISPECIES: hypothetical protein [Mesorhizobium]|uniref:hypothetical protein n=1 Tax=Mesorhizobium TaxID=68287 RepID=UPI000800D80B|nr:MULTISPECIES: hypothetical protein [Mesorhizobium]MUT27296.1 hypothetical protein [Mesorhizobium japonicum]OBQ83758.1 hypothetical protein A9K71_23345 [Mesorhizobium sp. WSM3873]
MPALVVALMSLTACGSVTLPAAVKLSDGTSMVGTTTAAVSGGTFKVATADGALTCSGTYDALDTTPIISVPVTCSNGKLGSAVVTRAADGMSGSGYIETSDGRTGLVAFGNNADRVLGNLSPATVGAGAATPVIASAAPQGPSAVPSGTYTPSTGGSPTGCVSPNQYGAISCITGLPKTNYVRGYFRKNGTYVRPYYRSHR